MPTTKSKQTKSWDDPENEATNNFVSWSEVGDFVLGTLVATKEVASTLPDKAGEMQKIYEIKVREASYHVLDEKKKVVEEPIVPEEESIVSVGGRKTIDGRMAHVKIGQIVGLKFTEELPSKTKGYNPTKLIKVYTPKDASGEFEMDTEFLAAREAEEFGEDKK